MWRHDADRGVFIFVDSDGVEHATFSSHDAIFSDVEPYPATEGDIEDEEDDWERVKRPIIPERVFDGDLSSDDVWDVVVVPSGATDPQDIALLDGATTIPLPAPANYGSGDLRNDDFHTIEGRGTGNGRCDLGFDRGEPGSSPRGAQPQAGF